jgi:hypothetical protein
MNRAIKILSIGLDKITHFGLGYMIADMFEFTGLWAILIATSIGVMKEVFDRFIKKGVFDWLDLAFTFGGAFLAVWINYAI